MTEKTNPIFIECDHRPSEKERENIRDILGGIGVEVVILPPDYRVATEQNLRPKSLDVQIRHFTLKYGVSGIIGIWEACIDGKRLPPHSKVTIELTPEDAPKIQIDFVGLIGDRKS